MTNLVKIGDKSKYMRSCYGILFDGKAELKFGNDPARNFIIFGVDNSSPSHSVIQEYFFSAR